MNKNIFGPWVAIVVVCVVVGASCSVIYGIDDECSIDADCESVGVNFQCKKNLCVSTPNSEDKMPTGIALLGGPCTRLDGVEDLAIEVPSDAIIIGSILPITGELSVAGNYFDHATRLATEEINRAGGVLGRKIIKISCDSGTSPVQATLAAEHLRSKGVQAVLGPFSSDIVVAVYSGVLRDAGMMVVSAGANAPIISSVSSEGLIWATSLSAAREATATAEHLLHSAKKRVAVIHRADAWGDSMFNAFYNAYCASTDVDCLDDEQFLVRSYNTADMTTSLSSVVTELSAWEPDVTVAFSYIDDGLTFLNIVAATGAPLGSLLWNSSLAGDIVYPHLAAEQHSVLCQIQATIQQMPRGIVYGSFLTRYRARWEGEDPVPYTVSFYDAMYMLAYAYAAASSDENPNPTGIQISAGMKRLSSGQFVNAGAEDWNVGVGVLRSSVSSTIDYVGASGDVNFSAGTSSMICPVEAIRFNVGDKSIESVGLIYSNDNTYSAPDYSTVVDTVCGQNIQP